MIELDLAQIYVRLGDLNKANGHFKACISDYKSALKLRMKHMGKYCQKTSDSHYCLAQAYTNLAAGEEDSEEAKSTDAEKKAWNLDSIKQYFECGLCFSGMAADMVKVDPTFKSIVDSSASNNDDDEDEEDEGDAAAAPQVNTHASKLKAIKAKLESFELYAAPPVRPNTEDEAAKAAWEEQVKKQKEAMSDEQDQFMFCYEMIEEMIECVESADKNMEVLHKAKENKEKAEEEGGAPSNGTMIGFGGGASGGVKAEGTSSGGQTTFGFGGGSAFAPPTATATATTAAPMMVVTKKKKKTVAPVPVTDGAAQPESKKARLE